MPEPCMTCTGVHSMFCHWFPFNDAKIPLASLPGSTKRWHNVGSLVGQRWRCWPNTKQRLCGDGSPAGGEV